MDRQQRTRLERHLRESKCPWGYTQVQDFARRAREPWGTGWTLLGRDLQVMAVRAQVCLICRPSARSLASAAELEPSRVAAGEGPEEDV